MFTFNRRPRYADIMSTLALVMAMSGTAYAAATITGADVVDESLTGVDIAGQAANAGLGQPAVNGSLTTYDIADGNIKAVDIATNAVNSAKVGANTLTGADINESTLNVVQGSGTLLTNRIALTPAVFYGVLLDIPGLGRLEARCDTEGSFVTYVNNTSGSVDLWSADSVGESSAGVGSGVGYYLNKVGAFYSAGHAAVTLSLGVGNDPGARRVATLRISAVQTVNNNPCTFQVQGTVWSTP